MLSNYAGPNASQLARLVDSRGQGGHGLCSQHPGHRESHQLATRSCLMAVSLLIVQLEQDTLVAIYDAKILHVRFAHPLLEARFLVLRQTAPRFLCFEEVCAGAGGVSLGT